MGESTRLGLEAGNEIWYLSPSIIRKAIILSTRALSRAGHSPAHIVKSKLFCTSDSTTIALTDIAVAYISYKWPCWPIDRITLFDSWASYYSLRASGHYYMVTVACSLGGFLLDLIRTFVQFGLCGFRQRSSRALIIHISDVRGIIQLKFIMRTNWGSKRCITSG